MSASTSPDKRMLMRVPAGLDLLDLLLSTINAVR
jgi:hypothetical protein